MAEWDSEIYPRVNLISEHLTWDPSNPIYAEQEDIMTDFRGDVVVNEHAARGHMTLVIKSLSSLDIDTADITITDDDNFPTVLEYHVSVFIASFEPGAGSVKIRTTPKIDYMTLSERWGISPNLAKKTVQTTTQCGVCTCLHISLAQSYPTNNHMMCYN